MIFLISGCEKNEDNVYLKGDIVGFVYLRDENGSIYEDNSGAVVSIAGIDNSSTTNEDGRFEFKNVPAGSYQISFDKTGFGTYKNMSFSFIGGNLPAFISSVSLYEIPSTELSSYGISYNNGQISITGTIPESEFMQYKVMVFLKDSSNVSFQNYDYSMFICANYVYSYPTSFQSSIQLDDTPFSEGDKIYILLYLMNYEGRGYYDPEKSQNIYTCGKEASDVVELVLE